MPTALITGITGQDGSYLAEYLLQLGYEVHGLIRRTSLGRLPRVEHLRPRLSLHEGDLLDQGSINRAVASAQPDEVYNLAAQSFVGRSWSEPVHTAEVTGLGALRVFEAVRDHCPTARVYQASSSEMYGNQPGAIGPDGPFHPRSPYGTAKLFAHSSAVNYRESHGLFVCSGILFNHESPRRGPEFVTRKVCRGAAAISLRRQTSLNLGNLDARRDWGWAPDYVRAMHSMLQRDTPKDFILGTGIAHSVRDLCHAAFGAVGLDWADCVRVDESLVRPAEIDVLVGNPRAAMDELGWKPSKSFQQMIQTMVESELRQLGSLV